MYEVKTVQGRIPCTQANEDIRVIVDDAFSLIVPKGMMFSTDPEEIGGDKLLAMFAPVPDSAELKDDSFDMQYGTSQTRVSFMAEFYELGGVLDLSDAKTRKKLEEASIRFLRTAELLGGLMGDGSSEPFFVVKSDEKAVVVAATQGLLGNAQFILGLPFGWYAGMYRVAKGTDPEDVMEAATPADYKKTAKKLLSTIEALRP